MLIYIHCSHPSLDNLLMISNVLQASQGTLPLQRCWTEFGQTWVLGRHSTKPQKKHTRIKHKNRQDRLSRTTQARVHPLFKSEFSERTTESHLTHQWTHELLKKRILQSFYCNKQNICCCNCWAAHFSPLLAFTKILSIPIRFHKLCSLGHANNILFLVFLF